MSVVFQKMHGAGNDFVLLDLRDQEFELNSGKAAELADRHTGVGCDQLLVLRPSPHPDCLAAFEVWNADGSRAEQCGNGVRCIGLYLVSRGETTDGEFSIQSPAARISMWAEGDGQFRVNMGQPSFAADQVPLTLSESNGNYDIEAAGQTIRIGAVSMGNPHALAVVQDISADSIAELGFSISHHPAFPQGCNAGFARLVDRNTIDLRVFERGSGETPACGSGACAAAVILINGGKLDNKVLVNQVGGSLIIEWSGQDEPVMMTGPAILVYEGTLQ